MRSHRWVILVTSLVVIGMFAFSFALVPIYNKLCRATGINTAVRTDELFKPALINSYNHAIDNTRQVTIQFIAINHKSLPWTFYPRQKVLRVYPGISNRISFYAKNLTTKTMTVQAIPSMTPPEAIAHFHKIQCFCFNQQTLAGGESREMGLVFQVDKDLPTSIHTITLAYTLFDVTPGSRNR